MRLFGIDNGYFNFEIDLGKCVDSARTFGCVLEDLPRLPPNREFEFGIKLLSGSDPIFIPSYRMALTELKELITWPFGQQKLHV